MTLRLALDAMATRFELVLRGDDAVRLRAAGEEALAEIRRLEGQLSFYRPESEISRINARAGRAPVRVEPRLFRLLERAARLHALTDGAFDPTVGPLMRAWGFTGGGGRVPDEATLAEARRRTGMRRVHLDPEAYTVAFERPGMSLDLGGIGKGYAIDEAALILKEAGVAHALLHGGTSTAYAFGRPGGTEAWKVAVPAPGDAAGDDLLAVATLRDEALSVSAVWGKAFEAEGRVFGHVLDPRSGRPTEGALLTAVVTGSAADADALSTALLVLGPPAVDRLTDAFEGLRALVASPSPEGFTVTRTGFTDGCFDPRRVSSYGNT